ncbi:MAG: FAD-dependent oxidoreductase [Bacteroidota bacterium]
MSVAIIGAGVSGLLTAYLLNKQGKKVDIFEKADRVGGNVDTAQVEVGGKHRWADLGVNDFNLNTYTHIKDLFKELDLLKHCKKLEDSTSFANEDSSYSYTINQDIGEPMPDHLHQEYVRFSKQAPKDIHDHPHKYNKFTVAEYLTAKGYSKEFAEYNLYPRINGMYYVNDETPKNMPITAVMHYYMLQEGFGDKKGADRIYIEGGISTWINALKKACGAKIKTGIKVTVESKGSKVKVVDEHGDGKEYDAVFMSCPADVALRTVTKGLTTDAVQMLSAFKYYDSVSVAHTDSRLLPANKNNWCTYNILIHEDYAQLRPYTISYVCNRHQNDAQNPEYNYFGGPEYFVTLNPITPIPDKKILRTPEGDPVKTYFRHNTLDFQTMKAQNMVDKVQGQNGIYFSAGWMCGAGLHEECYRAANAAVNTYVGKSTDQLHYTLGDEFSVPTHIKETIEKIYR